MAASGSTRKRGRYLLDTNIVTALLGRYAAKAGGSWLARLGAPAPRYRHLPPDRTGLTARCQGASAVQRQPPDMATNCHCKGGTRWPTAQASAPREITASSLARLCSRATSVGPFCLRDVRF